MVGGYAAGCGTQRCESRKRRCGFFSTNARERGLCFVRVQCERMAVLGPVVYRMKRFFEVTSFPLYNRARAATPACTHVGSLSQSQCTPPKLPNSLQKENTQSDPPQVSPHQYHSFHVTRAYTSKAAHAAPSGKNHTPLIVQTPPSLSNGTTNVHHIRHSGLFSLLFLSSRLIVTHSSDTHMVGFGIDSSPRELERIHDWVGGLGIPILVGRIVSALLYKGGTL